MYSESKLRIEESITILETWGNQVVIDLSIGGFLAGQSLGFCLGFLLGKDIVEVLMASTLLGIGISALGFALGTPHKYTMLAKARELSTMITSDGGYYIPGGSHHEIGNISDQECNK